MIRYDLKCANGCDFDAWFRDSAAFDALKAAGQLTCSVCGSVEVEKSLMAPRVAPKQSATATAQPGGALTTPSDPELARKLNDLRDYLDKNSDDVGASFADEARKIHYGESDPRQIHGVATPDEARKLNEEGVPVAPIPPLPRRDD